MAKPKHIFGFIKKFDLTHFSKMAKLEQASSSSSSTVVAIAKKLGLRRLHFLIAFFYNPISLPPVHSEYLSIFYFFFCLNIPSSSSLVWLVTNWYTRLIYHLGRGHLCF